MNNQITCESLAKLRSKVIPKGHASATSTYVESAKGAIIRDVEGREYIDFVGGIGVMNVGHGHPKVVEAITNQASKYTHTCFMILPYEPAVKLAEKLNKISPGNFNKTTLLVNSGAEAVENALKIARYATKRPATIVFENGYHGRTLLTLSLTSKVKPYKFGFGPFVPEIYRMPYAYCYRCPFGLSYPDCETFCADHLEKFFINHVAAETTAALIAEPIQGEGGFIVPPPEYFRKIYKICKDNEILFIADEIQSGMGRTGKMFAIEHWNIDPDIITIAKSIAAGMPISAVVSKEEIIGMVHPWGLGGTYGGNPVACQAALAVLEIYEKEDLLETAIELGRKLRTRLDLWYEQFEIIGDVRGLGAMQAIELVKNRKTKAPAADEAKTIVNYCHSKGLLINACGTFGNVIRFLMPLVISGEDLERGLSILEDAFHALAKS